ncbi:putative toxin [Psychrobacter lutiphocae]|uniref:putative toxin n=1 Tax=Psychrobacter lutiphocae TaxID=540500 RepID=UPI001ABEF99F|nr:VENN motif pre-toxin domain-containing protein [Psychrobacter lutiphocae]
MKGIDADDFARNLAHKLSAAGVGCIAASAKNQSCDAGAIGAAVGEMVAEMFPPPMDGVAYDSEEERNIINASKLTAGTIALLAGTDVNTAAQTAQTAVENNALKFFTTTGKVLYKAFKHIDVKKVKNLAEFKKELKTSLKNTGKEELINIADDLYTIFSKNSNISSRVLASIDLLTGTDFKTSGHSAKRIADIQKKIGINSKEVSQLKQDGYKVSDQVSKWTHQIRINRLKGSDFEKGALSRLGKDLGITVNKNSEVTEIVTEKGLIRFIPDAKIGNKKINLVEVKNVKYLSMSNQFRGYIATKQPIHLIIGKDTVVSEPLRKAIYASKGSIKRYDQNKDKLY